MENTCKRCHKKTVNHGRFCNDCFYPGIEETYDEYQTLLDEGHRRIQAATMSDWQDPEEAGTFA
ncbi:hypothetical protein [Vibrio maritimus]|uniref:hypothetical protein n=1 Tax=Vibrio maritimus TaxID=990268 RepID=UPI001F371030|nr:hypothetical protein [Vibrio maritimus]